MKLFYCFIVEIPLLRACRQGAGELVYSIWYIVLSIMNTELWNADSPLAAPRACGEGGRGV